MKTTAQVQENPTANAEGSQPEIDDPTPVQNIAGYLDSTQTDCALAARGFAELARLLAVVLIEWEGEDKSASYYCRPIPDDLMNVVSMMENHLHKAEDRAELAVRAARHRLFATEFSNPALAPARELVGCFWSIGRMNDAQVEALQVVLAALNEDHLLHQHVALALSQAEQVRQQMKKAASLFRDVEAAA